MNKFLFWILICLGIYFANEYGLFDSIFNYVADLQGKTKQTQEIQTEAGDIQVVKYRSAVDVLKNK